MKIVFKKRFTSQYAILGKRERAAVDAAIETFMDNPFHDKLYNHPLRGKLAGLRSISAGFDIRLIFSEQDGYRLVEFLSVGSRSQLYGNRDRRPDALSSGPYHR